jgi:hypothetical protein
LNQIAGDTSNVKRGDYLLSSHEIVPFPGYQQGRPYQQTRLIKRDLSPPTMGTGNRLNHHRNWNGHSYAESHIEEWLARAPTLLFPSGAIHVLASQNYAHLGEKIDLLLLDNLHKFHIVELKTETVSSNRGVTPDQIWGQMSRYVEFLRGRLLAFPASLSDYYNRFSAQFLGSPHELAKDLEEIFGDTLFRGQNTPPLLCRTFLTEGYDDYAVKFFGARQQQADGPIRLIYYRFNLCPETERHYIDFWEVPLPDQAEKIFDS